MVLLSILLFLYYEIMMNMRMKYENKIFIDFIQFLICLNFIEGFSSVL